ncbi:hypothetical protein V7O66_11380 [Methanolobus sp. ZRKC3]|uniref:hypothetical protein n=1 Tax=Methanolobus sp. ZRKC3 TaxID=3125786 RepID=UPI0032497658
MTRIAGNGDKISICTMMDIFKMKVQRDPVVHEVGPFIEFYGNHAISNEDPVIYEDDMVFQVYTKKVSNDIEKAIIQAEDETYQQTT